MFDNSSLTDSSQRTTSSGLIMYSSISLYHILAGTLKLERNYVTLSAIKSTACFSVSVTYFIDDEICSNNVKRHFIIHGQLDSTQELTYVVYFHQENTTITVDDRTFEKLKGWVGYQCVTHTSCCVSYIVTDRSSNDKS